MSAMSSISGVLGRVLGAAVGEKWVVGFSSFPSPSSPPHSLPSQKLGLQPPQGDFATPTGSQNEFPHGVDAPCHDEYGSGAVQGEGGKPRLPPPTSTTESVDKAESVPKAVGEGLSPPLTPAASFVDSLSPSVFALVACREGEQGKEGSLPKVGPPKVESVLGGLGSFVAGNPQLPPMGAENLAGRKGLADNDNGGSVEAGVGPESVRELASKPPPLRRTKVVETNGEKLSVGQDSQPVGTVPSASQSSREKQ